jgi:hypothetical protein
MTDQERNEAILKEEWLNFGCLYPLLTESETKAILSALQRAREEGYIDTFNKGKRETVFVNVYQDNNIGARIMSYEYPTIEMAQKNIQIADGEEYLETIEIIRKDE